MKIYRQLSTKIYSSPTPYYCVMYLDKIKSLGKLWEILFMKFHRYFPKISADNA